MRRRAVPPRTPTRSTAAKPALSLPPLRAWQTRALSAFASSREPDFLAVATPGAGKTTFALTAARGLLEAGAAKRLVVVVPTQHLKTQWASAADAFGLHLEPAWSGGAGRLPADLHGLVTTYQQVASSPRALRALTRDAFVVLDEMHHAGESRAWGDACLLAFSEAPRRLSLSGTPFRSDTQAIPFVRYVGDEAKPDFEYGYGDALGEGAVVRPVFFPRINGRMEWTAPDGSHETATFDDALDAARAGQRLRTALSLDGDWLASVLAQAHAQLTELRAREPGAGGMVIAMDQAHARGIARLLRERLGVVAAVATSDDPTASQRIARFATGSGAWLVAVRMVSEGVDIPRLAVGVYATNTTTDLFFRQAVGRFVRVERGSPIDRAFVFLPDDPRLRRFAAEVQTQRRHSLRRGDGEESDVDRAVDATTPAASETPEHAEPQLSLFAPISAVALGLDGRPLAIAAPQNAAPLDGDTDAPSRAAAIGARGSENAMAPAAVGASPDVSPRERRRLLRDRNAALARLLARSRGLAFGEVNAELNRRASIRRVDEATEAELATRLAAAEAWLRKGR